MITFDSARRYEQKKKFRVKKGDDFRTRYAAYDSEMQQNIQDMKNVTLQHALWAFSKCSVRRYEACYYRWFG